VSTEPESAKPEEPVFMRVAWPDWAKTPVSFANQFVIQNNGPEVYLTIGQLAPPPLIGSPEEMRAQAEAMEFVPVVPIARLVLTLEGAEQLHGALGQHIANTRARDISEPGL
jgi:hypothetical protein